MAGDNDDEPRSFASPPCFAHEVDPAYMGLPRPGETQAKKNGAPPQPEKPQAKKKPPSCP